MINPDATDAQAHGYDARRSVTTLTRELRQLADRLDLISLPLERGDGRATAQAGEIVSDYTQGVGSAGTRLWALVRAAGEADKAFHADVAAVGSSDKTEEG